MNVLLVALGAAVGAPLRFLAASWLDEERAPYGTLLVNLLGSFFLGFLSALALGEHRLALLGTGFCGGLTTYSAFAVQTVRLGPARGAGYVVVTVALSLALCALGFVIGS